jgi:hypothetical protein
MTYSVLARLTHRFRQPALAALAFAAFTAAAPAAVTWHDVQFGGFASQGYLVNTGRNDYLGDTSDGTFDFREYALNASYATGKWRVGAQAFGQQLGVYGDDKIKLDWAIVDYQATQWFGVRAGRVKMPRGLYNEALDLDSVRPFVLLPQSVYDARLRDFNAAFNGGMIYGNIDLHHAGSLDYRAFYGDIPMSTSSGASDYFNNDVPFPNVSLGMDAVYGGSLFWNTPLSGLRVGYSYSAFQDFTALRDITVINTVMYKTADTYHRHLISAEYTTGDWTFASEAGFENADYGAGLPGSAPYVFIKFNSDYFYVSAARRINRWLELGTYYSYSHEVNALTGAALVVPSSLQSDYALSARFDLNDHVIFKLEGHYLDGAGKIFDTPTHPQPAARRDDSWFLLAAKVTLSF